LDRASRSRSRTRRGGAWRTLLKISETRLGGYCSFALAGTLVLTAASYVLLPGHPKDTNGILNLAGTSPGWFVFLYGMLALGGVFGLAVVRPITGLAGGDAAPEWLSWARRLAYVAFAVTLVQGVRMATILPQLGALYHGCFHCPVTLAVHQDVARGVYISLPVDPFYWVIFGGVSLWTLAVSGASIVSAALPRLLSYLGLALTVGYWLIIFSLATGHLSFFAFVSVVTGVFLGPFWYIWLGVLLTARR
jgi:hypothetical protein